MSSEPEIVFKLTYRYVQSLIQYQSDKFTCIVHPEAGFKSTARLKMLFAEHIKQRRPSMMSLGKDKWMTLCTNTSALKSLQ